MARDHRETLTPHAEAMLERAERARPAITDPALRARLDELVSHIAPPEPCSCSYGVNQLRDLLDREQL